MDPADLTIAEDFLADLHRLLREGLVAVDQIEDDVPRFDLTRRGRTYTTAADPPIAVVAADDWMPV